MIDPRHLHLTVIRPVLELLGEAAPGLSSREAEHLLLGTAAVESHLGRALRQIVDGQPIGTGRGVWQVEPVTAADLIGRYLIAPSRRRLLDAALPFLPRDEDGGIAGRPGEPALLLALCADLRLGCVLARLRYWTAPDPLPAWDDVEGQARYWVEFYNRGGAGTVEKYLRAWEQCLSGYAAQCRYQGAPQGG